MAVMAFAGTVSADSIIGRYASITLDGNLSDWQATDVMYPGSEITAGLPLKTSFTNVLVANDSDFLYVALQIPAPAAITDTWTYNLYIDTDGDPTTGFNAGWMSGGYDTLVEYGASGATYSVYNFAGGTSQGNWSWNWNTLIQYAYSDTLIEWAIPRSALNATTDTLRMEFNVTGTGVSTETWAYQWESAAGTYTMATPPPPLVGDVALITPSQSWQINAAGTDLGTDWLDSLYDDTGSDWTAGSGLAGFTPNTAAYPAITAPLSTQANTYYFRTHFTWDYSPSDVAFVVTNTLSDGAVYYVNGKEVKRVRMPAGAPTYATAATGSASPVGKVDVFGIISGPLVNGDNVFEVETHQAPGTASDMVFGLSLTASSQYAVKIIDTTLPADRSVAAGGTTTFTAEVLGSGPLGYQWTKDGADIAGATSATYSIPLVMTTDAGAYALRITNSVSTNTTRSAVLTVTNAPVVFSNPALPADITVTEGQSAAFQILASGSPPLQYQWYKGSDMIAGETNSSYTNATTALGDAGTYHVRVTNPAGFLDSRGAVLTVLNDVTLPTILTAEGGGNKVYLTFSKPLDSTTASTATNYTLSGGVTVLSATPSIFTASIIILETTPQTIGTVYVVTVNHVQDRYNHSVASNTQKAFLSSIVLDGTLASWQGVPSLYQNAQGSSTATDFKEVFVYNDANYLYFRVTLWEEGDLFDTHNNIFIDTDNDPSTGLRGSELLIQGGTGYQEKNGGFNEGPIDGLGWSSASESTTDFMFRISRSATYDSDGTPVFTTNVINFYFDGENTSWASVNRMPDTGMISYTLVEPPSLPPGPLSIRTSNGQVIVTWTGSGTLQSRASLSTGTWSSVTGATSPYTIPASSTDTQRYFRLMQ